VVGDDRRLDHHDVGRVVVDDSQVPTVPQARGRACAPENGQSIGSARDTMIPSGPRT
jgi:hypothetical protein